MNIDTIPLAALFDRFGNTEISAWLDQAAPVVRRNRMQVLQHYPALAVPLAFVGDHAGHGAIARIIDDGRPLLDGLAVLARVKRSNIRILRGVMPAASAATGNVVALLRVVDRLPPGKWPRGEDDWKLFWRLFHAFFVDEERADGFAEQESELRSALLAGLLGLGQKKIVRLLGDDFAALDTLRDYLRFVGHWCACGGGHVRPNLYVKQVARRRIRDELLMRYPATEIMRQAATWHRELPRLPADDDSDDREDAIRWPDLPGLPFRHGDLTVCALTNRRDLMLEGRQMAHCVGDYWGECLLGDAHIVSIRDRANQGLSTAELRLRPGPGGLQQVGAVQHRSAMNGAPSAEAASALENYLAHLQAPGPQRQLAELSDFYRREQERLRLRWELEHDELSTENLDRLMRRILPDYAAAADWLVRQLDEEDAWSQAHNHRLGRLLSRRGLGDNLDEEVAWEKFRATGIEDYLDCGWRDFMSRSEGIIPDLALR